MKIDWSRVDPYLISVDFDPAPEEFEKDIWAIAADVNIGNKLLLAYNESFWRDLFRKVRIPKGGSMNGDFCYYVCSPKFKANPKLEYGYNPNYIHTAYVQNYFDKDDAIKHLESLVSSIGEVSLEEFTEKIHGFLATEEWDYLSQAKDFNK